MGRQAGHGMMRLGGADQLPAWLGGGVVATGLEPTQLQTNLFLDGQEQMKVRSRAGRQAGVVS